MTISNSALLDANILIYSHQSLSEFHARSREILEKGLKRELSLCICPQVICEFYAVVTNPRRVTNPISAEEATAEIEKYLYAQNILMIYPGPGIMEAILDLLKRYGVTKQKIFDLQLVATMLINNVTHIYTFNKDDFSQFKEIEVLEP